jgi:nucleotide-binding universal stress UspA family protein
MARTRRILHPTDFSPASRPAFRRAVELAKIYRARLLVAHVLSLLPVVEDAFVPPNVWDELQRGQRVTAQRQLARLIKKAKAAGARASGYLLDSGVTHEQIVRFARARRVDMIVMGTHGRSGLTKAILGSVASRVLASARCPVMTVRAK